MGMAVETWAYPVSNRCRDVFATTEHDFSRHVRDVMEGNVVETWACPVSHRGRAQQVEYWGMD